MATKTKKSAKKTKPAASKKSNKELTPLEKARLAKASGKTKKKAKKKDVQFKAPSDFKPFFMSVQVAFDRDGLFTDMKATRIKGSPTNENAKRESMALLDPDTLRRMAARYAGAAFIRNAAKRMPAKSIAGFLMRVGANRETGFLKVAIKDVKLKLDDKKPKLLDKKDPLYRAIRKPARFMAPAFTKVLPFPSAADLKALHKRLDGDEE